MRTHPTCSCCFGKKESGFSLVELMISITIGLFLLIGMTALLVSNSNTRNEMEKAGRQIENGRYALQVLSDDLQHAGFYGEASDISGTGTSDYCSTDLAEIRANMIFPVYGVDNAPAKPSCADAPGFVSGTDILVVRRAGTEAAICGVLPCAGSIVPLTSTQHYIQTTPAEFRLALGSAGVTVFNLKDKGGINSALLRTYLTRIYFIDKENNIPILKRAELVNGTFTTVSMVEGIDDLQLEYGVDDVAPKIGSPDSYTTAPAWGDVVSVRVSVLARNIEPSAGYKDTKTYSLGSATVGPFNDQYKRHVYSAVIRLNNPSGRREL